MEIPQTTALRRELGLRDLTLFGIACIVGARWIAGAAHAGAASITLFLLAAVFFVAPLSVAVGVLAVKYPSAGGMYVWARHDFGPWHGFLCSFVFWIGIVVWFPSAAMFYLSAAFYTMGQSSAHLADNRMFVLIASVIAIWIALGTNIAGVNIGKWTENVGAAATWILGLLLVLVALLVWNRQGSATPMNLTPQWNWGTVNFWGTIAFAMSGLELVGLMGAEIRNPGRTVPRAGWIASGFGVVFYAGATFALLVLLPPEKISEVNGLAQGGEVAGRVLGAPWISSILAILLLASAVGQFGGLGTSASRLPFAAALDGLLPAAFAKLHPRWATPYVAILVLGGISTALLILIQIGDTMRAAYQELIALMVIIGFLPYLYIFGSAWKAGKRISASSGCAVSMLAIFCSIIPTDEIHNVWLFESKLAIGTLGTIGSAWLIYRSGLRRQKNTLQAALPQTVLSPVDSSDPR